jgi:microcystin-dependent protein
MSNQYIGQITMFAGNFAPKGTALCNGQTMSIAQNTALFSLLGTTYGGNGINTFALPNLQSQLPVHQGQGPGLSAYNLGQTSGVPAVTIDQPTMPQHTHTFNATTADATSAAIANNLLPGKPNVPNATNDFYAVQNNVGLNFVNMAANAAGTVGGSQSHTNLMPSQCITFFIALVGIFPSRN